MKTLLTILFLSFSWSVATAQDDPQWIRYPAISPDGEKIAFTYKGNLYVVAAEGGEARQLTFHKGHDHMAVWSRDGDRIAFASDRYGNFNVFVMDAAGGPAERLTHHSNDEIPYSFTHDDSHVIFGAVRNDIAEHRQFPSTSQPELYKVPAETGRVGQVFTIPAELPLKTAMAAACCITIKKGEKMSGGSISGRPLQEIFGTTMLKTTSTK